MRIEVKLEADCPETCVVIHARQMDQEVKALLSKLEGGAGGLLVGFSGEEATVLQPEKLTRIYAEGGRVYAAGEQGTFLLRGPLYLWEQRLDERAFVRISQSEIIHLKKVKSFDLSLAGTICVRLSDGTETYASRRYVSKIKTILGI